MRVHTAPMAHQNKPNHTKPKQVYEDAFLLDTEQWEWTPISSAQAQELLQPSVNDQQQEQEEAAPMPDLLRGGPLHSHPGFLVGHTAVLASSKGKGGQGQVLVFGGQDRLGVRREDLLVLEG